MHHSIKRSQFWIDSTPMFSHEVLQIIMNMPTKQSELDPLPTSLFKQLVPHVIDDVTTIVNITLTRGDFTEEWKTACIKLLIKKITMELVSTSYRPVRNFKISVQSGGMLHVKPNQ